MKTLPKVMFFRCIANKYTFEINLTKGKVYKGYYNEIKRIYIIPRQKNITHELYISLGTLNDPENPYWAGYFKIEPKRRNQYRCIKSSKGRCTKGKIYTSIDKRNSIFPTNIDIIISDNGFKIPINTYTDEIDANHFKLIEPNY